MRIVGVKAGLTQRPPFDSKSCFNLLLKKETTSVDDNGKNKEKSGEGDCLLYANAKAGGLEDPVGRPAWVGRLR